MEVRPTVLLVDDEESVQKVLTYPLEREGYRVVQARDGEEALGALPGGAVDLVDPRPHAPAAGRPGRLPAAA